LEFNFLTASQEGTFWTVTFKMVLPRFWAKLVATRVSTIQAGRTTQEVSGKIPKVVMTKLQGFTSVKKISPKAGSIINTGLSLLNHPSVVLHHSNKEEYLHCSICISSFKIHGAKLPAKLFQSEKV
jgi:hypothetical protein